MAQHKEKILPSMKKPILKKPDHSTRCTKRSVTARPLLLALMPALIFTPNASVGGFFKSHAQEASLENKWIADGQATLKARKAVRPNKRRAKNVILFIADGMDPTTITAARIYDGQSRGEQGEENLLSFERFPYLAMSKTYNTNAQTPDSAGTMTAMITGVKTKAGVISLNDNVETNNCASATKAGALTIAELAEMAGMATGIISTARLTHATPAAVYAHAANRDWEADTNLSQEAITNGCKDIARQLIEFEYGDGIDLAMAGGRRNFLPETFADPEDEGKNGIRKDGRNLVEEWLSKSPAHSYVWNSEGFNAIDPESSPRVLGLFERSHMQYELDRTSAGEPTEPSLSEMTAKAIEILSKDKDGYFLMVEAGRVDHAHHGGNARRALHDAQMFSQAIAKAREMTNDRDTLIIATADHGHTLSIQGYPKKGNDILGVVRSPYELFNNEEGVALAQDKKPYTTLAYANGPGYKNSGAERPAPTDETTADHDYQQSAAIPLGSETHGGQDVTIYANGPRSYLFGGTVEQSYIFHVMENALNLKKRAKKK